MSYEAVTIRAVQAKYGDTVDGTALLPKMSRKRAVVTEAQVEHTQDFISRRVYLPHVTKKTTYHPKRRNSFPLLHGVFRPSAFGDAFDIPFPQKQRRVVCGSFPQ